MKVIIVVVVFCCVALLPPIIQSDDDAFYEYLQKLAAKGRRGELINGIFRLSKNGFLGRGAYGLTYKAKFEGQMEKNGTEVALKFTPKTLEDNAMKEYDIYSYLLAIDHPGVELFGIPSVYYFGYFYGYVMMAITLLQPTFNKKCENHEMENIDILITFREFTKITKYIHAAGIRHDDIKHENMMFFKHRAFIIDYNLAKKMDDFGTGGTTPYLSRRAHLWKERYAKDDWESFLYSMCSMVKVKLDWFGIDDLSTVYQLKLNTTNTLEKIKTMPRIPLRKVFYKFAKYVLDDSKGIDGYPNYDKFYVYFEKKIANLIKKGETSKPALVSWLTPHERDEAIQDLKENLPFNISKMNKPERWTQYLPVDRLYFRDKYHANSSSGASVGAWYYQDIA